MKRTTYAKLTTEQLDAIKEYAAIYGRTWKQSLRDDWMAARCIGAVHALRNSHGPSWLNSFKLTEAN
jgi:hypothetical protein